MLAQRRLRNGEILPQRIVLRLPGQRFAERRQRLCRLAQSQIRLGDHLRQHRKRKLGGPGSLPIRQGLSILTSRRVARTQIERRQGGIGALQRDAELRGGRIDLSFGQEFQTPQNRACR